MDRAEYTLRQIVDMTGLTEFTLRGWELRYGAFEPRRTETGQRRYSAQDLQKALLLRELSKRDHKIGTIAGLPLSQLKKMIVSQPDSASRGPIIKNDEVARVMKRVALQDWELLETELVDGFTRRKPIDAILRFFVPLMEQMASEVAAERLSIAQEHILSALLKQHLHRLLRSGHQNSKIKIIIASPEGDFHELGILAAHAMANRLKVCSIFIGPNTPKDQLCETASRFGASHVLLGSTVSKTAGAKDDFYSFVHFLDKNLPKQIVFWLAGRASQPVHLKRETLLLKTLTDLEHQLLALKKSRRET